MKPSTKNLLLFIGICICIIVAVFYVSNTPEKVENAGAKVTQPATRDDNMALGNPSKAGDNNPNNYLIRRKQYVVSYNSQKGTPNWVSWHLSTAWKGGAPRSEHFFADDKLPKSYNKVTPKDYSKSGFDRGHMCPSDDRDGSVEDNEATFIMDNIVPQAPKNNQEVWNELEEHARRLINQGNELYIIAGVYGTGGENKNGEIVKIIGRGNVTVPAHVWKIMVVLPNGSNDISRITEKTQIIAVDMPNTQSSASRPWRYYQTTIDAIEAKTGYDFLSNVPKQVQDVLEGKSPNQALIN